MAGNAPDPKMDANDLYREDTYTDRKVKYGSKDGRLHRLWQDPFGLSTTLFLGINAEEGFFVGADPVPEQFGPGTTPGDVFRHVRDVHGDEVHGDAERAEPRRHLRHEPDRLPRRGPPHRHEREVLDADDDEQRPEREGGDAVTRNKGFAVVGTLLVVAAIILGLQAIGGPTEVREERIDQTRVQDLQAVVRALDAYHRRHGRLPQELEALLA